ncbi:MAG TPA: PAS domain S-box protein [Granulicella sp.]|nr:PAS domain S-box protein [Granulicella sp.]
MKRIPSLERYALATIVTLVGIAIAWLTGASSSGLLVAVMVSCLYAGAGPGLLSLALSTAAFYALTVLPHPSLVIVPSRDLRSVVFIGAALLVSRIVAAKQRSEADRRQSDEHHRIVAETATDAMLVIDPALTIVFANDAARRTFGWSVADLIGQPLSTLIDIAPIAAFSNTSAASNPVAPSSDSLPTHLVTETTGHRRDGTHFPAEISFANLLRNGQRSFSGFVRDLSELKQSQTILRRNQTYLAEAQRLSHTGSFGWNLTTGEIYWTEESYRITDFPLGSKITMKRILDLVHPDDRQRITRLFEDAAIHGGDLDYEHRYLFPDGDLKYIHVVAHATRNERNEFEYIGAVTDITATRHAEEELRRSQQRYRDLIELSPDAIFVVDETGSLIMTNPTGLQMLGCTPEEAPGYDITATHLPEDRPAYRNRLEQIKTGQPLHFERIFLRKDGSTLPVEVVVSPIRNGCSQAVLRDIRERKHAQEALQRSEFYLSESEKLSHAGSWALDLTAQRFVYWSPENCRLQQHDPSQPLPTLVEESRKYRPEDWIRIREALEQIAQHKTNFDLETPRILADGTTQHVRIVGNARLNQVGEVVEIIGTTIDITEQARARAALSEAFAAVQHSEDQLRRTTDSIPVQVWSSASDGSLEYVNLGWTAYTGLTIDQVRGWAWIPLIHPDDIQHLLDAWGEALACGEPREVEARVRRGDGQYRWFLFRGVPLRNQAGDIVQWYGTNTDIEDRKRAEEALLESERSLRLIIDTIPALVWSALPDGTLECVNQRVVDYLGVTIQELAVEGWITFLHPDDVEGTLRAWAHAVATGAQHDVEYRMRCADGAYRWFHVRGQPLRNEQGRIVRWYGLLSDIEDRKNALEALRQTQVRLSRATQIATVGEFAASIAHEVNQPLAAVISNAHACHRWLLAQPPNLLEANLAAERIIRDSNNAAGVVRRIRALFKQADPEMLPLDLNDVLAEVLRLLQAEIVKQGVVLETELDATLPHILADRLQLQQVLFNLLQNGIEAMEGQLWQPKRLAIRARQQQDEVVLIEVRDYGPGLSDLDQPFEAFYTTKERGMGMGLAICRSIVAAHCGSLWAAPTEGAGATFCMTLPVSATPKSYSPPDRRQAAHRNSH